MDCINSFVYDSELVRAAVFPPVVVTTPAVTPPSRKRRKLDAGAANAASPMEVVTLNSDSTAAKMKTVLLSNDATT